MQERQSPGLSAAAPRASALGLSVTFRVMSHTITLRLSEELAAWLEGVAEQSGDSQGRLIREQLIEARASGEAKGFMRLAGAVDGPGDLSRKKGFTRS